MIVVVAEEDESREQCNMTVIVTLTRRITVTYAEKFTGIRRISPDPSLVWAAAPPRLSRGIPFLALRRPLSLSSPLVPPCPPGPWRLREASFGKSSFFRARLLLAICLL